VALADKYDVFISYAHRDNTVPEGAASRFGWVTTLAANLNVGPNTCYKDISIDHQLKPGDPFADDLLVKVANSRLLVLLLSQNYVDSEWCGKEVEHFVRTHAADPDKPRDVYVVELLPFEELTNVPPVIHTLRQNLITSKFWRKAIDRSAVELSGYPNPKQTTEDAQAHYFAALRELQDPIDRRVRELKAKEMARHAEMAASAPAALPATALAAPKPTVASTAVPAPAAATGPSRGTVWLADVPDDLDTARTKVRDALKAEGFTVVPEGDYRALPHAEFQKAAADDLARCDLFVQLLSTTAGRQDADFPAPRPQLQYQAALAAGKPIMQWTKQMPAPDDDDIDARHAELFKTATLRVTNREDFVSEVIARMRQLHRDRLDQQQAAAKAAAAPATGPRRRAIFVDDLAGGPEVYDKLATLMRDKDYDVYGLPPGAPLVDGGIDVPGILKPCEAGIVIFTETQKLAPTYNRLIYLINAVNSMGSGSGFKRWGVYLEEGTVETKFRIRSKDVVSIDPQGLDRFLDGL
jgi:hypothetical protein